MKIEPKYTAKYRMAKKQKLIEYKGGKCVKCGYDKIEYPRVFSFHHQNENEKDFSVAEHNYSFDKLKIEADKCILLCANCHAEEHDTPFLIRRKNQPVNNVKIEGKKASFCAICNVKLSKFGCKYCKIHKRELGRKVQRPSIEELSVLIQKYPLVQIGRQFNVDSNSIRKWLKFYKLPYRKKEIERWYDLSGSNR